MELVLTDGRATDSQRDGEVFSVRPRPVVSLKTGALTTAFRTLSMTFRLY